MGGSNVKITFTNADSSAKQVGSVIPISVKVTTDGKIASLAAVAWVVEAGKGRVANASAFTDSLGAASALWVLGDSVGLNTLAIGAGGDSAVVHARTFAGPGSVILRTIRDSISATPGSSVTISGRVVDFRGNAAASEAVQWTTSAGTLTNAASTSDSTGAVSTVLKTTATAGTYIVTATLPNRATVLFKVATF